MTLTQSSARRLHVAEESVFGTDPSASGASGYSVVVTTKDGLGDWNLTSTFNESNLASGFPRASRQDIIRRQCEFPLTTKCLPMSAATEDGDSFPADDAQDFLLNSAFGDNTEKAGHDAIAASGSTYNTGDDTDYAEGDLIVGTKSAINSGRALVGQVNDDVGTGQFETYSIWGASAVSVGYGFKQWRGEEEVNNKSLSCYYEDDGLGYTGLGGRAFPQTLTFEAGQLMQFEFNMRFNAWDQSTKGSLPNVTSGALVSEAMTPIKGELGQLYYGSATEISGASKIAIAWGPTDDPYAGIDGVNGIVGFTILDFMPTVTVDFPASDTYRDYLDTGDIDQLTIKLGSGVYVAANDILSCWVFGCMSAQVIAMENQSSGRRRNSVTFRVIHHGFTTGTTPKNAPYWTLGRC